MSAKPVGQKILWAVVFAFAVVCGVGLRRWKGDAFRSNIVSNAVMWVGIGVGYFLAADRDDEQTESE